MSIDSTPYFDGENWDVRVDGEVEEPKTFTWAELTGTLREVDVSDFHCVTNWSRFDNHWAGVSMGKIAKIVKPKPGAKFVMFHSVGDYKTSMSIEDALTAGVMLVYEWEGKPLPPEHGGPIRCITPHMYAYKGAKWLEHVEFMEGEELGFWEKRGYSQTARPWKGDDRWSF